METRMRSDRLARVYDNLYALTRPLPRAYMAPRAIAVANRAEAVEAVLKEGFDPRQYVVLEKDGETEARDGGGGT